MTNVFNSEEAALEQVSKLKTRLKAKFCPVTLADCREQCASFYPGHVYEQPLRQAASTDSTGSWHVYPPECTCALVTGRIVYENE